MVMLAWKFADRAVRAAYKSAYRQRGVLLKQTTVDLSTPPCHVHLSECIFLNTRVLVFCGFLFAAIIKVFPDCHNPSPNAFCFEFLIP